MKRLLFADRRFRVFDWATRWFWVVVLWEDGRFHVGRYGPTRGRWFHALKWEPVPDRRGGEAPHD